MFDCAFKNNCPYLNNRSAGEVLAKKLGVYWKQQNLTG